MCCRWCYSPLAAVVLPGSKRVTPISTRAFRVTAARAATRAAPARRVPRAVATLGRQARARAALPALEAARAAHRLAGQPKAARLGWALSSKNAMTIAIRRLPPFAGTRARPASAMQRAPSSCTCTARSVRGSRSKWSTASRTRIGPMITARLKSVRHCRMPTCSASRRRRRRPPRARCQRPFRPLARLPAVAARAFAP